MAAYTTIDNPELYFQAKTYTGTGSSLALTFDGSENMQPDMVWLKGRSNAGNHFLYDTVRGANRSLVPNDVDVEDTSGESTSYLTSFDSDGITLGGSYNNTNASSRTYVAWAWKAGTTGSGTTNGSKAYSYSASPDAGFSIVTYTGNATAGHLIPHGMGKVPRLIHVKSRGDDNGWHSGTIGSASAWNDHGYLYLNNAFGTDANQFGATPDTTNFRLGTGTGTNGNNGTRVAYCFADVQGYQKIGKYSGNGNADGPFVYCGFKPAFVMVKRMAGGTGSWWMRDNKIAPFNLASNVLQANDSGIQADGVGTMDFLSNGFKLKDASDASNNSSGTYFFQAIAESPFVTSTGVPATAR
jgi:hypothetical protein